MSTSNDTPRLGLLEQALASRTAAPRQTASPAPKAAEKAASKPARRSYKPRRGETPEERRERLVVAHMVRLEARYRHNTGYYAW